jgi:PAN domain-containing protein
MARSAISSANRVLPMLRVPPDERSHAPTLPDPGGIAGLPAEQREPADRRAVLGRLRSPAVLGPAYANGGIWGVNSSRATDRIALASYLAIQIEAEIRAWDGSAAEANIDRPGGDFSHLTVANAGACSAACDRDGACRAWSFVGPTSVCYLKANAPDPIPNAGVTSGLAHAQERDGDRAGNDYMRSDGVLSADDCESRCARDYHLCKAWTWVVATSQCWLKDAVGTSYAHTGCTSGVQDRAYEVGFDRPGGDLRQLATPTANDCGWSCALDASCKAFVWSATYKSPGTQNNCWLKRPPPCAAAFRSTSRGSERCTARSRR